MNKEIVLSYLKKNGPRFQVTLLQTQAQAVWIQIIELDYLRRMKIGIKSVKILYDLYFPIVLYIFPMIPTL